MKVISSNLPPRTSHKSMFGTNRRILMVTGAYDPEFSGGGLQCRAIIRALRDRADFSVLTTATDPALPHRDQVEGIDVFRIHVDLRQPLSKLRAMARLWRDLLRLRSRADLIHIHGFSFKSVPIAILARLFGQRLMLTLQTGGHDEPETVRRQGWLRYWAYRQADLITGVSPRLQEAYLQAGLPPERFRLIPNGVDGERFRPAASSEERRALKQALGLPPDRPAVLFVGFFSREKAAQIDVDAEHVDAFDLIAMRQRRVGGGGEHAEVRAIPQRPDDRSALEAAAAGLRVIGPGHH